MKKFISLFLVFVFCQISVFAKIDNQDIKILWQTIEDRKQNIVDEMAKNPFPSPVIDSSPDYGIGMVAYALTNLYNNENLDTCNGYIIHINEKFNVMLPHTGDFKTYFQMTLMARIWFLFNSESLYYPGRLTKEAEAAIKEYFLGFLNFESKFEDAQKYDKPEYYLHGSGNHHVIKRSNYLLGSQILKADDKYKDIKLPDGYTVTEHFEAWKNYWKHDLVQRGKTALEVEYASNGYYKYTMDVFMCLRDFAESSIIRDLAQRYLDVIFADIAIQTNNGIYGGARGRSTRESEANVPIETFLFAEWLNLQSSWRIPEAKNPFTGEDMSKLSKDNGNKKSNHPNQTSTAMSNYLPLQPIADLLLNNKERGSYEYFSTPPGRGKNLEAGFFTFEFPSEYLRYSYVNPDYIVGAFTYNRELEYNAVQQQNRHAGINFTMNNYETSLLSRVFPDTERNYSRGFNDLNTVAHKGAMLAQGLPEARYYDPQIHADIMICVSNDIYGTISEENGWLFGYVPNGSGYIAIKPSKGKLKEWKDYKTGNVKEAIFTEKNVPIIMQAGSKEEYGSFSKFKAEVKKTKTVWNSLSEFEYIGPKDVGSIKWYTDFTVPKINNQTLALSPKFMIKSPFVNGDWGTGIYEIKNQNGEAYTINFEYDENDEVGFTKMLSRGFVDNWNDVKLSVNGSFVSTIQTPIIKDGSTLVPIRELFEALDIKVNWDNDTRTITANVGDKKLSMQIDYKVAIVDNNEKELSVPAQLIGGKTMVPVRFVAEEFGAKVKWDEVNKTVVIWKGR